MFFIKFTGGPRHLERWAGPFANSLSAATYGRRDPHRRSFQYVYYDDDQVAFPDQLPFIGGGTAERFPFPIYFPHTGETAMALSYTGDPRRFLIRMDHTTLWKSALHEGDVRLMYLVSSVPRDLEGTLFFREGKP